MENEVKASDLIKVQQEKEARKTDTYYKIYKLVEKKICIASSSNLYYTWYQIPEFFVGLLFGCKPWQFLTTGKT